MSFKKFGTGEVLGEDKKVTDGDNDEREPVEPEDSKSEDDDQK